MLRKSGGVMAAKKSGKKRAEPTAPVTHPEKVYWPEDGYTKGQLVEFYRNVFPLLQPYVADRLLTMERCPDGMNGQCFYQKEKPESLPADTPTKRIANVS